MKNFIWTIGGLCAATAGFLVWSRKQQARPVEALAHRLEEAWADHHTRV
jgi:ribose/xylose/arabinose/galactoside ABC-type transport system permease subunit